jgi:hypothetical protein
MIALSIFSIWKRNDKTEGKLHRETVKKNMRCRRLLSLRLGSWISNFLFVYHMLKAISSREADNDISRTKVEAMAY